LNLNEHLFATQVKSLNKQFYSTKAKISELKAERKIYLTLSYAFQNELSKVNREIDLTIKDLNEISKQLDMLVNKFSGYVDLNKFEAQLVCY
jgi:uncharacterized coiled-coil DUF342 family protein